ncbi:hypothetical protein ACFLSE_09095 [Bacteroidota bacterium]
MKRETILIFFLLTVNILFGQKANKYFEQGNNLFDQGKFKEAISMYDESLKKEENREVYYLRGLSKLNLNDTCGFCSDIKSSADLYYEPARFMYKNYCIKCDTKSYELFKKGEAEFLNKNYEKSEYWLSESINSYKFVDNMFLRGLTKLYVLDTNGYCLDMKKISPYSENAKYNYNLYCIDTTFYDNSFTRKVEKSSFFEVKLKPPTGFVYDLTKSDESFAIFSTIDTIKAYQRLDNNYLQIYTEKLQNYVNKKVKTPPSIERKLKIHDIFNEYYFVVICIASETGELIHFVNGSSNSKQLKRMSLNEDEEKQFNDILMNTVLDAVVDAPKPKPLYIGDKAVKAQYVFMVKF